MRKKVIHRKRRILDQLKRASASIEWDMWKHKGWRHPATYDSNRRPIPENEAQRELVVAIEKIKEASEIVKKFHGLTHHPKDS